jgi:general secretion pathway protein G
MIAKKAFTLIELLLVVIIIGALAAMIVPRFTGRGEEAKRQIAQADILTNIPTALKLYELDNGDYPASSEGLQALLSRPGSSSRWKGPYLERKPLDPWDQEYKYKYPGEHRSFDYDLYSVGRDGQEGTSDDITNWQEQ